MLKMNISIGSKVTRMLGGCIPMEMRVVEITDKLLICQVLGSRENSATWMFDKTNGREIDDDLGIGFDVSQPTVSYLILDDRK